METEFPIVINLPPKALHQGLYEELEDSIKKRLEGKCRTGIGYIKKGTVQVISKQIGKSEGAHLTGNVTYHATVRCQAAMPAVGQRIACMVVNKNEFGVLATNYQLPAYTMLIMKMPDDTSDALERIQRGSYIEVEVLAYQLKADNMMENTKSEYWLVCSLLNGRATEAKYQALPSVTSMPQLMINKREYNLDTVNDKRSELTGSIYADLEDTKNTIQLIRQDYINMLIQNENGDNMKNDIVLSTILDKFRDNFVIAVYKGSTRNDRNNDLHKVTIIWTTHRTLKPQTSFEIEVKRNGENLHDGAVVVYMNLNINTGLATKYSVLDFWGRHVKYIVNESEMIYPNGQYLTQLSSIVQCKKTPDGVSRVHMTKEDRRKLFTENGKPIATLIYRDNDVINRAYYKMREFIKDFGDKIFLSKSMSIGCIAESPGGFIQALLDKRVYRPGSTRVNTGVKDNIIGISIGIGPGISAWGELKGMLTKYPYVKLDTNEAFDEDADAEVHIKLIGDNDGDIHQKANRERFYQEAKGGLDLITADGGIERNKAESTEEMDTHRLLLAEIIMALNCQKQGGSFILKIYDMATEFTMNMIQVLCYAYNEVGLYKPNTSRSASSEKYLVCTEFTLSASDRDKLLKTLEAIHNTTPNYYGNVVMVDDPVLKKAIINYNGFFMKKQIGFIEAGRSYATLYNTAINNANIEKMTFEILAKIGNQTTMAEEFFKSM